MNAEEREELEELRAEVDQLQQELDARDDAIQSLQNDLAERDEKIERMQRVFVLFETAASRWT